jgi:hypothetical protein
MHSELAAEPPLFTGIYSTGAVVFTSGKNVPFQLLLKNIDEKRVLQVGDFSYLFANVQKSHLRLLAGQGRLKFKFGLRLVAGQGGAQGEVRT